MQTFDSHLRLSPLAPGISFSYRLQRAWRCFGVKLRQWIRLGRDRLAAFIKGDGDVASGQQEVIEGVYDLWETFFSNLNQDDRRAYAKAQSLPLH